MKPDRLTAMLSVADLGRTMAAWKGKCLPVTDPRVTDYGMKEFELRDPDGYWLWFGQPASGSTTVVE